MVGSDFLESFVGKMTGKEKDYSRENIVYLYL
jgi:hypothetical protein